MTREEFDKKCREVKPEASIRPTTEEYKIIEYVYSFHPSISETEGKQQIAMLYTTFGMGVIRDMLPRAEVMEKLEADLRKARTELNRVEELIRETRSGGEI